MNWDDVYNLSCMRFHFPCRTGFDVGMLQPLLKNKQADCRSGQVCILSVLSGLLAAAILGKGSSEDTVTHFGNI